MWTKRGHHLPNGTNLLCFLENEFHSLCAHFHSMARTWQCHLGATVKQSYTFNSVGQAHANSLVRKHVTSNGVQSWVSPHETAYVCGDTVLKSAPGLLPGTPSEPLVACSKCYQSTKLTATHHAYFVWNKASPKTKVQPPDLQLASLGELVHSIIPQERRDQLIGFDFNFNKKLPKSVRRTNELMRTLTMILEFIFALAVPD